MRLVPRRPPKSLRHRVLPQTSLLLQSPAVISTRGKASWARRARIGSVRRWRRQAVVLTGEGRGTRPERSLVGRVTGASKGTTAWMVADEFALLLRRPCKKSGGPLCVLLLCSDALVVQQPLLCSSGYTECSDAARLSCKCVWPSTRISAQLTDCTHVSGKLQMRLKQRLACKSHWKTNTSKLLAALAPSRAHPRAFTTEFD